MNGAAGVHEPTVAAPSSFGAHLRQLLAPAAGNDRVAALDGVRGLAVFLVFFVHFDAAFGLPLVPGISERVFAWASHYGNYGVDLFFVLSGWLLYRGLVNRPQPYGAFLWRRVRRLYPTFLVVFAIYLVLSVLAPEHSKLPDTGMVSYLIANLLLLPGVFPVAPLIVVAWSLSYEAMFYLTVPWVVRALRVVTDSAEIRLAVIAVATVLAAVSPLGHTVGRFLMFAIGMMLSDIVGAPELSRRAVPVARVLLALALVRLAAGLVTALVPSLAMPVMPALPAGLDALVTGCALGSMILLAIDGGGVTRAVCRTDRLRWLGNISYSYYLIHGLTINTLAFGLRRVIHLDAPPVAWALLPVVWLATVAVAFVLYAFVEYPWSIAPLAHPTRRSTPRLARAGS